MKNFDIKHIVGVSALTVGLLSSCTDLDEKYYDAVDPSHADATVIMSGAIGQLRGLKTTNENSYLPSEYVYFMEVTSDEVVVPSRLLIDWYNKGIPAQLQKHTWTPDNSYILTVWDCYYNVVSNCNSILKQADEYGYNDNVRAQLRVLRAFAYSELLNSFGNVPLNLKPGESNTNSKKADVYQFLIDELNDPIMENLPKRTSGQMNQAIRHSLLARLYLNSKVYLDLSNDDAVYKENLRKCIAECEIVEGLGYVIEPNIYNNFAVDNEKSRENILTVPYDGTTTIGNFLTLLSNEHTMQSFLGSENTVFADCVNGPCLNPGVSEDDLNATFNLFDKDRDSRFLSIIWGQQYAVDPKTGEYLYLKKTDGTDSLDVDGKPILDSCYHGMYTYNFGENADWKRYKFYTTYAPYFEKGIYGDITKKENKAMRGDGARMMKYELTDDQLWEMANDWVIIRLAEIKYMKAESYIRLNENAKAVDPLKEVLAHRGCDMAKIKSDPKNVDPEGKINGRFLMSKTGDKLPLNSLEDIIPAQPDLVFMDKEWRREFLFEGHRRMTMIRMDKFQGTWGLKKEKDAGTYTNLFPIPSVAIRNNTTLKQNPGYEGYDGWLD